MKCIAKSFGWLLLLVVSGCLSGLLIFSFDVKAGLAAAGALLLFCLLFFIISVIGLAIGSIRPFSLKTRIDAAFLLLFSFLLSFFILAAALANGVATSALAAHSSGVEEKVRLIGSQFFHISSQKGLKRQERNGVIYFYSKEQEPYIIEIDELLMQEKERFDQLFGEIEKENLAIELHTDPALLSSMAFIDDAAGYYSLHSQTIHLSPHHSNWKPVLLHEYTHHRSHQFAQLHGLNSMRIPQWFEEGAAEYLGDSAVTNGVFNKIQLVDFRLLDTNEGFHEQRKEGFSPYVQSRLAVESLVKIHGEEVIPELLHSETTADFYKNLEVLTALPFPEFQEALFAELETDWLTVKEKLDAAKTALEDRDYEKAELLLMEVKAQNFESREEEVDFYLKELYLKQEDYTSLVALLEKRIAEEDPWSRMQDLLTLSEIYLLQDSEKALVTIEKLKAEKENGAIFGLNIEQIDEAYRRIYFGDARAGYRLLIEEDLFLNELIKREVIKKVNQADPGILDGIK